MKYTVDEENMHLLVKDPDGNIKDCEIIMYYYCKLNQKDYVFYTDNELDEDNDYNIYASRFLGIEDGEIKIDDIETEDEWALLDEALEKAKLGLQN